VPATATLPPSAPAPARRRWRPRQRRRFCRHRAKLFCAALLAAAPTAGADSGDGAYVGLVPVPDKLTLADVKDRVVKSFHKFQILDAGDDFVVGHYARNNHTLTLTVRSDAKT
jgi:hypothetical protein